MRKGFTHIMVGLSSFFLWFLPIRAALAIAPPQPITGVPKVTDINELIQSITDYLITLVGAVAVLFLVIAGYFFITARGEEGQLTKAKNSVAWCVAGLMLVVVAKTIVDIFFKTPSEAEISAPEALTLIVNITNFVLSFVGAISVLLVIYGGYLYITARGEEGQMTKGKNTLVGAIIGIILVIFSYAIVSIVITGGGAPAGTP